MNTHTDTDKTAAVWTPEKGWHNVTETERKAMQRETVRRITARKGLIEAMDEIGLPYAVEYE